MKKRKQRRKWCFSLFGTGKKTQILENVEEKNPTGLTNFFPPDLGGKLGRKERKGSLTRKLHIYPSLVFYGKLRGWLVSQILVDSLSSFLFSFVFVQRLFSFQLFWFFFFYIKKKKNLFWFFIFWKNFFGFLNFLSSFYFSFLMKKSFIHNFLIKYNVLFLFYLNLI